MKNNRVEVKITLNWKQLEILEMKIAHELTMAKNKVHDLEDLQIQLKEIHEKTINY